MVTIGFNPATYSVREDAGGVSVTLSVQAGTLGRDVILTMTTMNSTAMRELLNVWSQASVNIVLFVISAAGTQYTHASTDVTFNAGITTQMVTVPILDNTMVEDSMSLFSVVLTSTDSAVVLNPATADVTIEDDDRE